MRKRQKGGGAIATSHGFTRCSIIVIECSRPIREMINCNVLNKDTLFFFFCGTYLDSVTVPMVSGQGVWRNLRLELKSKHTDGFFVPSLNNRCTKETRVDKMESSYIRDFRKIRLFTLQLSRTLHIIFVRIFQDIGTNIREITRG